MLLQIVACKILNSLYSVRIIQSHLSVMIGLSLTAGLENSGAKCNCHSLVFIPTLLVGDIR